MSWISNRIDLGQMYENSKKNFSFEYVGNLKILKITPGCSNCTKTSLAINKINVEYKSSKIPVHIAIKQNFQIVTKYIIVKYENGDEEKLIFTAKIIKK